MDKKNSYFVRYKIREHEHMTAFDLIIKPGTCATYIMNPLMIDKILEISIKGIERKEVQFLSICLLNSEKI